MNKQQKDLKRDVKRMLYKNAQIVESRKKARAKPQSIVANAGKKIMKKQQ